MAGPQLSTVNTANENAVRGSVDFMYAPGSISAGQQVSFADSTGSRIAGSWQLPVTASGGATVALTSAQAGGAFALDAATGVTYTLPAPSAALVGMQFDFITTVTVTSNSHKIVTDASTTFVQGVVVESAGAGASMFLGNGTTHRSVTANGTTTGGILGSHLSFTLISATVWQVVGFMVASGTIATPFATS